MTESVLDALPGVGPARKAALLRHFGSADRFLAATPRGAGGRPGGAARRWRATSTTTSTRPPGRSEDGATVAGAPRGRARRGADDHHRHERRREEPGDGRVRGRRLVLRRQPAARACCRRSPTCSCWRARGWSARRWSATCAAASGSRTSSRCSSAWPRRAGVRPRVVFLEASDETLINRFRETRRRHPLSAGGSVSEGIERERAELSDARERADVVIDTTGLSIWDLRRRVAETLMSPEGRPRMHVQFVSFGYKHGVPARRRPADGRALPPEPALRAGAAAPHRARPRRSPTSCWPRRAWTSSWRASRRCSTSCCPPTPRRARPAWSSGSAAPAAATAA